MAICEFCGKEIPEGEICGCSGMAAENAVNGDVSGIVSENDTYINNKAEDTDPLDFLSSAPKPAEAYADNTAPVREQPSAATAPVSRRRRVNKKALMRRRRFAALLGIILFFSLFSFVRNHTGCRGAVHRYWNCVVDEKGGEDYYSLGLPNALIRHFKDTGEWDNLIGNYQSLSEKAVKLRSIKKIKRMTKDELRDSENYLYHLAEIYGAKAADGEIIADKGYFVTVVYKFGDERILGGAYYVRMEGDGWKVLPHDMGSKGSDSEK